MDLLNYRSIGVQLVIDADVPETTHHEVGELPMGVVYLASKVLVSGAWQVAKVMKFVDAACLISQV